MYTPLIQLAYIAFLAAILSINISGLINFIRTKWGTASNLSRIGHVWGTTTLFLFFIAAATGTFPFHPEKLLNKGKEDCFEVSMHEYEEKNPIR